jgi:quercetin dioxygenase-like cupin family protein
VRRSSGGLAGHVRGKIVLRVDDPEAIPEGFGQPSRRSTLTMPSFPTSQESAMNRTFLTLAVCAAFGIGGMAVARHDEKGGAKVTDLSRRDIVEKLDGKDARVTVEEVTIEPGERVAPHRHAGPVFGYVLEGEYEHALNDDRVTTYKAGDTFYEPSGCVHRLTRNPSARAKTRLLAVILHPRDTEKVTVPEEAAKND